MPDMTKFAMPQRLEVDEETATDTYCKFIAEPLEEGFGHTLGNALRRVLLSSLEGTAVSWIKIDGVPHEFTSVDDVLEDVTEIVLNFKQVLLTCSGEMPRPNPLEINVNKAGVVTAGDIELDGVTTILNPELPLCTVDKARELRIEVGIDQGRGYRSGEDNKSEDQPIGVIPIDCLFSPVKRVAYSVHDCRVGQRTDYDRLEIEVWTDGRIGPVEAMKDAALIMQSHLNIFAGTEVDEREEITPLITSPEDEAMLRKLLRQVSDMELSVRALNCLNNANIRTVGELVCKSEAEMMKYRNFGQKSLLELKEKLSQMDLHLGVELKDEVRVAFENELEKMNSVD